MLYRSRPSPGPPRQESLRGYIRMTPLTHRHTAGPTERITDNAGAMTALGEADQLIHILNRGAMRVWTRMLLRDIPAEGFNLEELRRRAQTDAFKDDYLTLEPVHLDTNRVTAGVACM